MALSMTGFGTATGITGRWAVELEVRSLNNRYMKVRTHVPGLISTSEGELESVIRKRFSRGTVDLWIKISDIAPARAYQVDMELARRYREFAGKLGSEFDAGGKLTIADYLSLPGVVSSACESSLERDELMAKVRELLEEALDSVEKMRAREGEALAEKIGGSGRALGELGEKIAGHSGDVVTHYRDRLLARVNELLPSGGLAINEEHMLREISIFAERSDISEELARIESHLDQLAETLSADGDAGRKLEFVAQELHREINTIGSKANDAEISRLVVDAKCEVDKIREQAANIE